MKQDRCQLGKVLTNGEKASRQKREYHLLRHSDRGRLALLRAQTSEVPLLGSVSVLPPQTLMASEAFGFTQPVSEALARTRGAENCEKAVQGVMRWRLFSAPSFGTARSVEGKEGRAWPELPSEAPEAFPEGFMYNKYHWLAAKPSGRSRGLRATASGGNE